MNPPLPQRSHPGSSHPFPKTLAFLTKAAGIPGLPSGNKEGWTKFKSAFVIVINAYSPSWKLKGRYRFTFTPLNLELFRQQVKVLSNFLTKFKGNDNLVATVKQVPTRGIK